VPTRLGIQQPKNIGAGRQHLSACAWDLDRAAECHDSAEAALESITKTTPMPNASIKARLKCFDKFRPNITNFLFLSKAIRADDPT
jgi:hypothetical protein